MEVLILIIVLVLLVLVHELGHFIAAKATGMRVDEFGIGYPPRALTMFKKGETTYTLNWLPFGGFVKIYGEDGEAHATDGRAFSDKNRFSQAIVLVAGIAMNLLFALILISASLAIGTPRALDASEVASARDASLVISDVVPGSPAAAAGLVVGDEVKQVIKGDQTFTALDPAAFTPFVASDAEGTPITFDLVRDGSETLISAVPKAGVIPEDPTRPALGVALAVVGTVPVSPARAIVLGAEYTWAIVAETATGLAHFLASFFTFSADLSQVSGPVGIAGAVGTAANAGFGALVSLTAVISVNLALINLIPVPALDGGRLLFVIIEAITRRKIKPNVANAVNSIGFALLIILMVVVTGHDIWKLVG
ncbi:MAG TPA: M50 family metallopeptidase [Candidatus Paceibacterota bacterium]|nr:M50 family metallopeptidase [Candidatus Paceibacterota bacterium]